jgi:hypothetical protein
MPAPVDDRPLLEVLRESSARHSAPREGLLGLLAQPANWEMPEDPAPAATAPVLTGQLIAPIDPQAGGLLSAAGFGFQEVPADSPPPQGPHFAPAPVPQFVPMAQPHFAPVPEPQFIPVAEPQSAPAPEPQHILVSEPQFVSVDAAPPQSTMAPPPPASAPAAPVPASSAQRSLAEVFRMVKPAPQVSAEVKRTESLQHVLSGLRPARQD